MTKRLIQMSFNAGTKPVARIVDGEGVYFILDDGSRVIDGSNTGGPLGHRHPVMMEALQRAISFPVVNDGWFWAEREDAAQELIDIAFEGETSWIGGVRFCLSGGEANDLALSLSQAVTGRSEIATRERAYHGMTGLSRNVTVQPHWHGGLSSHRGGIKPVPRLIPTQVIPSPIGSRYGGDQVDSVIHPDDVVNTLSQTAAVIVDYTQGGIYYDPVYQNQIASAAQKAGSLWIADEVVTGLGRYGRWFAFQGAESRPDIVTLGKPLAGGAAAAGAVVLSKDLMDQLQDHSWQTYSTFRGHPVMIAGIRAFLRVLVEEGLVQKIAELEDWMEKRLIEIAKKHPSVARVDGRGLHWTIELDGPDWRKWKSDTAELPIISQVALRALEHGALLGTSGEQTSLFIAPPLIIKKSELEQLLEALDQGLQVADEAKERSI